MVFNNLYSINIKIDIINYSIVILYFKPIWLGLVKNGSIYCIVRSVVFNFVTNEYITI